jgi:hypothetical protein
MKRFLVNKNDIFNTSYPPVVNFDTGFLFLGNFLIVRNDMMNQAFDLRHPLSVIGGEDGEMDMDHKTLFLQKLSKRRAMRCAKH